MGASNEVVFCAWGDNVFNKLFDFIMEESFCQGWVSHIWDVNTFGDAAYFAANVECDHGVSLLYHSENGTPSIMTK